MVRAIFYSLWWNKFVDQSLPCYLSHPPFFDKIEQHNHWEKNTGCDNNYKYQGTGPPGVMFNWGEKIHPKEAC